MTGKSLEFFKIRTEKYLMNIQIEFGSWTLKWVGRKTLNRLNSIYPIRKWHLISDNNNIYIFKRLLVLRVKIDQKGELRDIFNPIGGWEVF